MVPVPLVAAAVSLAQVVMTMKDVTNQVILGLLGLRSSGFRVAELRRTGKLSLVRLGLGRCLAVAACISCGRDVRLLQMKMSLEQVLESMLLASLAVAA
jgi:hypothetical protein